MKFIFENCHARLQSFQAAEAFAITSIIASFCAFVFGCIRLCCCDSLRIICMLLSFTVVLTSIAVIGIMTFAYQSDGVFLSFDRLPYACRSLNKVYNYGAGFVLYIIAFIFEVFAFILAAFFVN
uniref:Uncharacterized protein n=1 Tax=Lygus hesperus TaxID=30085 RepID=A0A0A9YGX2_LYGHE